MIKRHPFHAICPYFAMFPEQFVEQQLLTYTTPGDLVFDPFCGRGTTVFESLLNNRRALGMDINPVAACIASAKARAPKLAEIVRRIDALEARYQELSPEYSYPSLFFEVCFEQRTFAEISFLRKELRWKLNAADCFIAAVMLGILHGESHRTDLCLSNRMPRTISTKPEYSIRWWSERKLTAPRREVFQTLRKAVMFRYRMPPADGKGIVRNKDARQASKVFEKMAGQVRLVVTSPPYLDTTDYSEDQWLRLWFLGGKPIPEIRKNRDDRHTQAAAYWHFLEEVWAGMDGLLAKKGTVVIRIGGAKLSKEELFDGVTRTLRVGLKTHKLQPLHNGVTSSIRPRETSAFRPARRQANMEHDFVYCLA